MFRATVSMIPCIPAEIAALYSISVSRSILTKCVLMIKKLLLIL